jgi:MinD-like ATPase involved in chromosome partitioning or flagellar assembly
MARARGPLRLAVGIGDPERERDMLPELDATPEIVVAERCLSADTLLEAVLARRVDAVLVAYDLHRLARAMAEIEASGIPRVLLVPDPEEQRWQTVGGVVLANTAPPPLILDALRAAAYLDADPTRNVYMVAYAEPDSAWEWHTALEQECQALDRRSPHARVLCGIPKPDMRGRLGRPFLEGLLATLRHEARYVVLDTGAELLGNDGAFHRAALGLADHVLLVASADLVGIWHARNTLKLIREQLQIDATRVALVVNRHDPRFHHARVEIEWAPGIGTAAVVPHDHAAVQRSVAAQRPLVLDSKSRRASPARPRQPHSRRQAGVATRTGRTAPAARRSTGW